MVPRERQGNCRIRWGLSAPHAHVAGRNLLHAVVASRATSASDSTPVLTERIAKPAGGHDCQALGVRISLPAGKGAYYLLAVMDGFPQAVPLDWRWRRCPESAGARSSTEPSL